MNVTIYKALEISQNDNSIFERKIVSKNSQDLPKGDLLIQVKYSSLNYKDALSSIGNKGVTKEYPHTPGIDAAGIVVKSKSEIFEVGDAVIVTGFDLGMNTAGGFGEYISVPKEWAIPLPKELSLKESMIYGTAGFTAALSVHKLTQGGIQPEDGEILVTGATGGVGTTAIALLSKLGYRVIAATGKASEKQYLQSLGAQDIIHREELDNLSDRPLLKSRWAGVIDTVGGNTLTTALKTTQYGGCVTCCGNVSSPNFSSSIFPFILRGISLYGIDSVQCPMKLRLEIWDLLATKWRIDLLNTGVREVSLDQVVKYLDLILEGKHVGRTIIRY